MLESSEIFIAFRQELHRFPELSGDEEMTARAIEKMLRTFSPSELVLNVGGYGIVATWDSGKHGKHIMFRADFDALPIEEINEFAYKSTVKDLGHKCGHDGHTTILLALASWLNEGNVFSGKISLVFQPAEETGEGARAMLEDKNFPNHHFDYVFALHNLPGFPLHDVMCKQGIFSAAVTSMVIKLTGKTAHAAEPEFGINPCEAIAEILQQVMLLHNNEKASSEMSVIAPVYINAGKEAYGVTASEGEIHFTIRCWQQRELEILKKKIEKIVIDVAAKYNLRISHHYLQTFTANDNEASAVKIIEEAAKENSLVYQNLEQGFKWGEDFGLFTQKYTGAMFGIGAGENCPALHQEDYDFPDALIETGKKMFVEIINIISAPHSWK